MRERTYVVRAVILLTCIAGIAPAGAEEPAEPGSALTYQPPVFAEETISLIDAIRITLEHQPNIRLQEQNELYQAGLTQQATGQFDMSFVGDISYDFTSQETGTTDADTQVLDSYTGDLNLGLTKQLRSGTVLQPFIGVSSSGFSYEDAVPTGTSTIDQHTSAIGFAVDVPLGRGRGVQSTGAQEKAFEIDQRASIATTTHTATSEVLQTTRAYWSLLAAQRTVAVLERSLELNTRLLELSRAMVDADEMPRAELARALAREAESRARVEEAQRQLYQARLSLVTTIGLQVADQSQAPLAADDFPEAASDETLASIDLGALTLHAFDERRDYAAAKLQEESDRVLFRAATLDLSPQTDLGAQVSLSGFELDNNIGEGIGGALFGDYTGPSAGVDLSVDLPIKNNAQRGQLEQQRSVYNQRAITTRDLARKIQSNVVLTSETLKEAARQVRQYAEAVEFYRETVNSEVEKFKIGMSTLLQTNFTEQNQISAELALISSQSQYAQLLAQLRFESATLLTEEPEGWIVDERHLAVPPVVEP
jgi:outer membrane protein TolC